MTDVGSTVSGSSTAVGTSRAGLPCSHFFLSYRRLCPLFFLASFTLSLATLVCRRLCRTRPSRLSPPRQRPPLFSVFSALPPPVGFTFHSSFGRSTTSRGDGGLGWFRAETDRVIRSVAHSFVYIQRLDIKPVYTAVDRSQHPYSAQEAARDKQTRIAVERSSLVFSVVQADSRALGQPSSAAGNTHIGWLECRLASSVGSNSTVGVSGRCAVLRHSHGSA